MRQQQDGAYELSLRADMEKERLKQLERDEILRQQRAFEDELQAEQQRKEVCLFVDLHCLGIYTGRTVVDFFFISFIN